MSRRKAHSGGHANHERWLLTYADLITLLLIYFIVLFAMSSLNAAKYKQLETAISSAFNVIPNTSGGTNAVLNGQPAVMQMPVPLYSQTEEQTFERIKSEIKAISRSVASGSLDVRETPRGVVISIEDRALFAPGSATLDPAITRTLAQVSAVLRRTQNHIRVEGHTDDTPIHTAQFPSNWELSTARATNVLHYLIDHGHLLPSRLSAAGYGEYFPRVPNTTKANRAKNRRVDIVLLRNATMAQEPSEPDFSGIPAARREGSRG